MLSTTDTYTLASLVSNNHTITQDFINTCCITMFEDYLRTFENPDFMLDEFMGFWKENIIENKKDELRMMDNGSSLEEMVALSEIQQDNNLKKFSNDVSMLGDHIRKSIKQNLKED